MKKRLKIAYLVVGENLAAPLLRRQVVELLGEIKKNLQDADITVFLFYPIHSIIVHRDDIRFTRRTLLDLDIRLVIVPSITPWPLPNLGIKKTHAGWRPVMVWGRWACRMFKLTSLPTLMWLRLAKRYTVFHCRSYPATSAAVLLKRLIVSTGVLFDPRSDFPEENITAGNWERKSRDFRYWKAEERLLVERSDAVACIAPSYAKAYQNLCPKFNYFLVPNNVNCSDFQRNTDARERIRRLLGIAPDESVFLYLGSLSATDWNRPDFYRVFYDALSQHDNPFRFLILTGEQCTALVHKRFAGCSRVIVKSPRYSEVGEYLSAGDYGMMFLGNDSTRLGTKVVEYMAASLQIIVNENCKGAADLLRQYPHLGHIVHLGLGDRDDHFRVEGDLIKKLHQRQPPSDSISAFAVGHFDNAVIAKQYADKYYEIEAYR